MSITTSEPTNTEPTNTPLDVDREHIRPAHGRSAETKPAFKTSEFVVYLAAVAGVLLASMLLGSNEETSDFFSADKAWFYVTLLSIGYMISRGLAKSGSREHHDA